MEIQGEIDDCVKQEITISGVTKDIFCKKAEIWAEKTFNNAHIRTFQAKVHTSPHEIVIKDAFVRVAYGATPDMTIFLMNMLFYDEKVMITISNIVQHMEGIGCFKVYEKNRCKKLALELTLLLEDLKNFVSSVPQSNSIVTASAELPASVSNETTAFHLGF